MSSINEPSCEYIFDKTGAIVQALYQDRTIGPGAIVDICYQGDYEELYAWARVDELIYTEGKTLQLRVRYFAAIPEEEGSGMELLQEVHTVGIESVNRVSGR